MSAISWSSLKSHQVVCADYHSVRATVTQMYHTGSRAYSWLGVYLSPLTACKVPSGTTTLVSMVMVEGSS